MRLNKKSSQFLDKVPTGLALLGFIAFCFSGNGYAEQSLADTIAKIKPGIVAVGTYMPKRSPRAVFLATGFAVGDGSLIVTNAPVSYTHLRAHETGRNLVCRLLLE